MKLLKFLVFILLISTDLLFSDKNFYKIKEYYDAGYLGADVREYFEDLFSKSEVEKLDENKFFYLIDYLYNIRDYERSLLKCESFIKTYQKSHLLSEVIFIKGLSLYYLKDYKGAIDEFKEIILKYPNFHKIKKVITYLINSHIWLKEYETAREVYNKFVSKEKIIDKDFLHAYCNIGFSYFLEAKYEEAINHWKKLVEEYPNSEWVIYAKLGIAGCYYNMRNYNRVIKECQEIILSYEEIRRFFKLLKFLNRHVDVFNNLQEDSFLVSHSNRKFMTIKLFWKVIIVLGFFLSLLMMVTYMVKFLKYNEKIYIIYSYFFCTIAFIFVLYFIFRTINLPILLKIVGIFIEIGLIIIAALLYKFFSKHSKV